MDYLVSVMKAAIWGEKPPNAPRWKKWTHSNWRRSHCDECLVLDGCWFFEEKTPRWPHHLYCDCVLEDVPYSRVLTECSAESAYSKYDPYLFDINGEYGHNKDKLFGSWGYSVEDSAYLKAEIEKQGKQKYVNGEYQPGKLNDKGQRISIIVELERKDKNGVVTFVSGWMVRPNGQICLTTPYGGKGL